MANPDFALYEQNKAGTFTKKEDRSGPYVWDGTTMVLMSAGATAGTMNVVLTASDVDPILNPSATFNRPADTTAYAVGDLVANNTVAGNVAPMQFTITNDAAGSSVITKGRIRKTGTGVANAFFRLHLYRASPVPSNGDNGAWLTDKSADYLGAIDFGQMKVFTDGAASNGAPEVGYSLGVKLAAGQIIYGLLEARGAYTPANAETFVVTLETEEA